MTWLASLLVCASLGGEVSCTRGYNVAQFGSEAECEASIHEVALSVGWNLSMTGLNVKIKTDCTSVGEPV